MKATVNNPADRTFQMLNHRHFDRIKNHSIPQKQNPEKINWSDEPYSPALAARILEANQEYERGESIHVGNTKEEISAFFKSRYGGI